MKGGIPPPQVAMLPSRYFQTVGAFPSRHLVKISFLAAPYLLTSVKGWVEKSKRLNISLGFPTCISQKTGVIPPSSSLCEFLSLTQGCLTQ